jgi:C-terminal processing protease CtpA/Prc
MSPRPRTTRKAPRVPQGEPLPDFLAKVQPLPASARYQLVQQAQTIIDGLYVHLRLKRAMYGIDPVQRLRLLTRRLDTLSDLQFHAELSAVFRSLRDLHTTYQLPDPYRGHVATLGFLVERYFDRGEKPHYIVSKRDPALGRDFQVGAELTAWNGIPIDRAVELNADRQAGSNPAARIARGLEALTLRSLRTSLPPDEAWVIVEYLNRRGNSRELRIPWRVLPADTSTGKPQDPVPTIALRLGIDASSEATRNIKRTLFATAKARLAAPQELHSVLRFEQLRIRRRGYAYLRIYSFNVSRARHFLETIARSLQQLPQEGLIIDIRSNPGGHIPAAEGLLQLLTNHPITPARFSMSTAPLALALCEANPELEPWADSIAASIETGEPYSQPFPLSDPQQITAELPAYPGPKLLITDALCYSAADIFAAGFQDNQLGPILGTATQTGAGGANVWSHDLLQLWLPDSLQPLSNGASFRLALRRATRTGAHDGVPLEDLGVTADQVHLPTKRDLASANEDLKSAAGQLLSTS